MKSRINIIRKFIPLFSNYKSELIMTTILLVISSICISYAPKLAGDTVDLFIELVKINDVPRILTNIALLTLLYLGGYLLKLPSDKLMSFIGQDITYQLRIQLYDKTTKAKLDSIKKKSAGNVMSKLNNDLMNISGLITTDLFNYFSYIFTLIIGMTLLISQNWKLSLVYIISAIVIIVFYIIIAVNTRKTYLDHQVYMGELAGKVSDSISNHLIIQAYNCEDYIEENHDKISIQIRDSYKNSRVKARLNNVSTSTVINLTTILIYVIGVYLLILNEIALGTLLTVILYGKIFIQPLKYLGTSLNDLETTLASMDRIDEILTYESERVKGTKILGDVTGNIELKNVYNINLTVTPGEVIAITGQKSLEETRLFDALMRLDYLDSGEILLDGTNISEISSKSYRSIVSYIPKEKWIFRATVAENIGYGAENYSLDDVKQVCELIGYDKIINKMPNKYDTKITNYISEGEKDLIYLGRALIKNPKILLVDNINLDISEFIENRTVFIATDDEKIIERSDKVIDLSS